MRSFIVIGIYILVPFLTSFLYKKLRFKGLVFLTHLVTGILILIYPYFLLSYDDLINPPEPEKFRCGMPMLGLYIGNTIFMIPITQGLLALCNWYFKNYKQDKKIKTSPNSTSYVNQK